MLEMYLKTMILILFILITLSNCFHWLPYCDGSGCSYHLFPRKNINYGTPIMTYNPPIYPIYKVPVFTDQRGLDLTKLGPPVVTPPGMYRPVFG